MGSWNEKGNLRLPKETLIETEVKSEASSKDSNHTAINNYDSFGAGVMSSESQISNFPIQVGIDGITFFFFLTCGRKHNTKARKITWKETSLSKRDLFWRSAKKKKRKKRGKQKLRLPANQLKTFDVTVIILDILSERPSPALICWCFSSEDPNVLYSLPLPSFL